jgi:hypothetical protein
MGCEPTVLAILPLHNSPGKRDVTGAFAPEADGFARKYSGYQFAVDNHLPPRLRLAQSLPVAEQQALSGLAIFCHGTTRGLPSIGWSLYNIPETARALTWSMSGKAPLVLYACSAGIGYLPRLCSEMRNLGWKGYGWGHSTRGHTTYNPHVVYCSPENNKALPLFNPKHRVTWRQWVKMLKSDFRFEFPFMTPRSVVLRVRAAAGVGR